MMTWTFKVNRSKKAYLKYLINAGIITLTIIFIFNSFNSTSRRWFLSPKSNKSRQTIKFVHGPSKLKSGPQDHSKYIKSITSQFKFRTYPSSPAGMEFISVSEEAHSRFLLKLQEHLGSNDLDPSGLFSRFWDYFPPSTSCPFITERIGRFGDGGKWICGFDHLVTWPHSRPCVVYSFGVAGDSSFESEVLDRTPCKVYAYDPTVPKMELNVSLYPGRVFFSQTGVGSGGIFDQLWSYKTLDELMNQNGHEWIDLLKIDIEGDEYEVLDQIMRKFEELPFAHLNVEVHLKNLESSGEFRKYFEWWRRLEDKGLRAHRMEANYIVAMGGTGPRMMEYSFINIKPLLRD